MKYIPGKHYELSSGEHYDENAPQTTKADCIHCGKKKNGIYRGSNAAAHTYFCEEGFEYDEEAEKIIKYHSFGVETEANKKQRIKARNKERVKGAAMGAGGALGAAGTAKVLGSSASEETTKSVLDFLKERVAETFSNPIQWLEDQFDEFFS